MCRACGGRSVTVVSSRRPIERSAAGEEAQIGAVTYYVSLAFSMTEDDGGGTRGRRAVQSSRIEWVNSLAAEEGHGEAIRLSQTGERLLPTSRMLLKAIGEVDIQLLSI